MTRPSPLSGSHPGPCLFLLALAALPACALAQAAPSDTPQEVVVRARFSAYQGDAAFSTVDLRADDLGRAGLDETLKREAQASLFRRSASLTANPTVQGISLRAIGPSGAGRALVTLDGVPQNDPFGNWVIWAALPDDAISHVHVLRGAGGGAYGAGALTGVIDLSLAPARGTFYGDGEAGEGGNGKVAAGVSLGDVAAHYVDQTLRGDTPVRSPQAGAADVQVYGRDRSWLAHGETALCPTEDCGVVSFLAGAYDSRRDTGLKGATATSTGSQAALSLTQQPSADRDGWRLQVWHRTSDLSNTSVSVAAGRTGTTLANNQVATPATGDGLNAALRHRNGNAEWEIGIDGRMAEGESREFYKYVTGLPTRYRVSGGATALAGVYAEGSDVFGRWSLGGAVRADQWRGYDGHRTEADTSTGALTLNLTPANRSVSVVSGRLGVGYSLSADTTARLAAYTGFRPPSLNELYRPFRVGNDVTESNADLRPESLKGVELGLRSGDAKSYVDADVFANRLDDPITNVTVGLGPLTSATAGFIPAGGSLRQRQNIGDINAYGMEARGRYALGEAVALTASLTLTHARVENANAAIDGRRPAEAPDYSASVGLEGRWAGARFHADLAFEGQTFDDDLNTLPLKASRRLSLDADYPLTPRVTAGVSVDNALDDRIAITHAGDGTIGYDNRRRVMFRLSYRTPAA